MSAFLERLTPDFFGSDASLTRSAASAVSADVPTSAASARGTASSSTREQAMQDTPAGPATYSRWPTLLTVLCGDVIGLLSVLGFTYLAAAVWAPGYVGDVYAYVFAILPAFLVAFYVAGLYGSTFIHPALEMQRASSVIGCIGVTVGLTVWAATGMVTPSLLIVGGGLLGAVIVPIVRVGFRILLARTHWWGLPTVVLSQGGAGQPVIRTLQRWPEIGLRPVAHLTDARTLGDTDVPVLGGIDYAPHFAREFKIPYAVLALPEASHDERVKVVTHYSKFFEHIFVIGDAEGAPALWTTGRSGDGLFGYGVRNYALQPAARRVKRLLDVIVAAVAVIAAAPVLATIAVLIKIDDGGPIFYRQQRMGREGRVFPVLKFRTMYTDAHERLEEILQSCPQKRREYERYHKLTDDPRVTGIGGLLRRTSLDELPQLFNVLRGEMSLVGPRAYMPGELPEMKGLARAVLQTPPGITGLWQVSGRNALSFGQRVDLDVHYIQNWSFWLDLYVLVRTIPVVLSGEGAS